MQATENFEKATQEQRRVIESLSRKIESLEQARTNPSPAASTKAEDHHDRKHAEEPTRPLHFSYGPAHVDLGLMGTFAVGGSTASDIEGGTQLGGHDPNQRGFTVQGVEAALSGEVEPHLRGNISISFSIDSGGESIFELEEAWLETLSLPGNLQVRAGQIFTAFGRHNPTHLHEWGFVDVPLVNGSFLGPDGLRNPGARLAWQTPTPFRSELSLGVQNSQGETASSFRSDGHAHGDGEGLPLAYRHSDNDRGVKHFSDLLLSPRYAVSFDLTDSQELTAGASAAFGPNSRGGEGAGATDTQIYGADLLWKWKLDTHSHRFVAWQTEAMLRKYDAGAFSWDEDGNGAVSPGEVVDVDTGLPALLSGETLTDYGLYSQVLYGFRERWVAGLRFDYLTGDRGDYERRNLSFDGDALGRDPLRDRRWRLAPNLTWYPSQFAKVRLQYNYDDRRDMGVDHSVWLQFEFAFGGHSPHEDKSDEHSHGH